VFKLALEAGTVCEAAAVSGRAVGGETAWHW